MKAIRFLLAYQTAAESHATTVEPRTAISAGLRIIGIRSRIPDDARIIQGGLSSPVWLEVDGDCGVAGGVKIESLDPPYLAH